MPAGQALQPDGSTMAAIVHALYIIGQLFAVMGVVFVVPLLMCDCCRYCWKRRCARREQCAANATSVNNELSQQR